MLLTKPTVGLLSVLALAGASHADTMYNQGLAAGWNVGTGQPNTGFVVNTNTDNGVETGLNAMYRFAGGQDNTITSNLYEFHAGLSPTSGADPTPAPGLGKWDIRFSAALTGGYNVGNTSVLLTIDWDPTAGEDIRTYNLSSIAASLGATTLVQDSENLGFSFWSDPTFIAATGAGSAPSVAFNPNALGTYHVGLEVVSGMTTLSSVNMDVLVVPLPNPALMGTAGLGIVGLTGAAIRRRRKL